MAAQKTGLSVVKISFPEAKKVQKSSLKKAAAVGKR
jgi:hypothetical protein